MTMTIKEIADELGVTKPAVRKLMDDSFRKQFVETTGNTIRINDDGLELIRKHFTGNKAETVSGKKPETETGSSRKQSETETKEKEASFHRDSAEKELIDVLKGELAQRNNELAEMRKLLDQNQQLLLNAQNENQRLLALQEPKSNDQGPATEGEYSEVQPKTPDRKQPETKPETNSNNTETDQVKKKPWWKIF